MESRRRLSERIRELDSQGAVDRLQPLSDAEIAATLAELGPGHAIDILEKFPAERRARIAGATLSGHNTATAAKNVFGRKPFILTPTSPNVRAKRPGRISASVMLHE